MGLPATQKEQPNRRMTTVGSLDGLRPNELINTWHRSPTTRLHGLRTRSQHASSSKEAQRLPCPYLPLALTGQSLSLQEARGAPGLLIWALQPPSCTSVHSENITVRH